MSSVPAPTTVLQQFRLINAASGTCCSQMTRWDELRRMDNFAISKNRNFPAAQSKHYFSSLGFASNDHQGEFSLKMWVVSSFPCVLFLFTYSLYTFRPDHLFTFDLSLMWIVFVRQTIDAPPSLVTYKSEAWISVMFIMMTMKLVNPPPNKHFTDQKCIQEVDRVTRGESVYLSIWWQ